MSIKSAAFAGQLVARSLYSAGAKSVNKLHGVANQNSSNNFLDIDSYESEINPNRIERFNAALDALKEIRNAPSEINFLLAGRAMLNSKVKAANCGELSMIAAAVGWEHLGKPSPAPIALVNLSPPSDHVFCVFGDRDFISSVEGDSLAFLAKYAPVSPLWVADPWLNIVCQIEDYHDESFAKLAKWQLHNKRIAWAGGPQGCGWYPPTGTYRTGFLSAELKVKLAP